MRPFDYASAATVDDAIALLTTDGEDGSVRPLAGGTDLLPLIKADISTPARLVDVKRVPELSDRILDGADGLELGALATLAQLELHGLVRDRYTALAEAAALAATPQLRNMATVGGNLLQRPRCWYFRSHLFKCWLKGGDECQAREGENQQHAIFDLSPCVAVHPSDLPTALLALDAVVRVRGADGERTIPLADFFAPPTDDRRTETLLGEDELILSVRVPSPPPGTRSTYLKAMDRKVWAFALVGVAAVVRVEGEKIADARLGLTGVANVPWRARAAE
ncbi:MAG: FAD binding domain-containing protein, partial [Chloroflexota bacterium]|nr:FAD binding domain-containing protein [Chloroflexota bacterium]